MRRIISQNADAFQIAFDFAELAMMPVPDLAEVGITITPLPQIQASWWSELEYKHIPKKPGIYAIINMQNGHFYIGSAIDLYRRKSDHFKRLKAGNHVNPHLQNAYNRDSTSAFRFAIVERVDQANNLIVREQHYMDLMSPEYNIARVAGNTLGVKHTDETKAKLSKAKKGKKIGPMSEEARKNMSAAMKGRPAPNKGKPSPKKGKPISEQARKNISEGQKGRIASEGTRAKLSESLMGHEVSETTRGKISAANKGKPAHNKGKPMPETVKAILIESHKGKPSPLKGRPSPLRGRSMTEEQKARISEAKKGKKRGPMSLESIAQREETKRANRQNDPTNGTKKAK